jgi:hypothetical protein
MIGTARRLATLGALCAAASLAAQSAPAPAPANTDSDPGIVVNGKAQAPGSKDVFNEALGVSRIGPHETYVVALPRFFGPICPGVFGLRTDYAEAMVARMRDNASKLKIRLAKPNCSPNLVVAFEDDGKSLLSGLQRDRPQIFRLVSQSEQTELLAGQAPVRAWNNIATRWTGAGAPPEKGLKPSVWGQLNRNSMPWSFDIIGALVVFERSAVEGMTLTQLADYATMRGLSHTRPANAGQPMTTILSLFDNGGGSPGELTEFDSGYLRSLYWSAPNASAAHKLLDVERWAVKASDDEKPDPAK